MLAKAMMMVAGMSMASLALAQAIPKDTEAWTPEPARVKPGAAHGAPSDAVVLFGGKDLGEWVSANAPDRPAPWTVAGGAFTVRGGSGDIQTRRSFTDYQLHIEWRVPSTLTGAGQARGNSGVFLASTGNGGGYEIQILDCHDNKTYVNGQAASIYKQHIPLVNACAAPGEWQSYDIVWTAPRFAADGTLASPAYVTALHNGVLVQNHVALQGESVHVGKPAYRKHGALPIRLQDHGDAVSFRNVWVRPL